MRSTTFDKLRFSFNNLRYFRVQIFLAFSSMLLLIIIWFLFYLHFDNRVDKLNNFKDKTQNISKDFSSNIRNFQSFLLFGYKDKNFYILENQKDINVYIQNLKIQRKEINEIFKESKKLKINLNPSIVKLSKDIDSLFHNVILYKNVALIRGFKDYGVEGKMRTSAHLLELTTIDKVDLFQLRRHEKDFIMRAEDEYFKEFEKLYAKTISNKRLNTSTKFLLNDYKKQFEQLVLLSSKLGFSHQQGLYGKINDYNKHVEDSFVTIIDISQKRVNVLKNTLFYFQLFQTFFLAIIAVFLSVYISNYFTKDLKILTLDISNFINSNFKDKSVLKNQNSSIMEIDFLLKAYVIFKEKLAVNINFLEKTTEEANNNASFKTQFLANMSHEIRSPLNGVIGMLNLLKTKSLSKDQTEYVEIAEHSADHLLGLVNMILDHSKMEAGKMKLECYPIHLKKELSKLIRLFEYRIKDKNIELHFIYDDLIATNILADNLRLQQVLINLLDNAIKFTSKGVVKLEVKFINRVKDTQYLNFKITDSGIGIDPTKTEQMLLAFEQADLSTTRKYGGTGLGLTISNQLIQLMGGSKLNIHAIKDGGSSFSFELPFKINLEEKTNEISQNENIDKQEITINKVLIVEDNVINQKVLCKLLEKINIHSDIANNGKEALVMYEKNDYDIIFMDLHMPEMDGFEATNQIHLSAKYKQKSIPIIAVTASAFDEDKVKAISSGMDDFITKPIVLKNLEETIVKQINLQIFQ